MPKHLPRKFECDNIVQKMSRPLIMTLKRVQFKIDPRHAEKYVKNKSD